MNKKQTAYISLSIRKRKLLDPVVTVITTALTRFGITPLVFVDNHHFTAAQEQEMMQQAMKDIDGCSLLIAETSDKGIGIGVEVGYARAKGKPVIYLRHQSAKHSSTVSGISNYQIIYANDKELKDQITAILKEIYSA